MTRPAHSIELSAVAVGTPEQYRWLNGIVKSVLVFNLLDGLFTLTWVQLGLADEANTLMRDLVNEQAVTFMMAKLTLVSLGSLALWRNRTHPLAVIAIFVAFLAYYLVLLYHLEFSSHVIFGLFGEW